MTAYVPGITETDLKKIVLAIQQLAAGRSNAVGSVTLATGASSTMVTTANCAAGSFGIEDDDRKELRADFQHLRRWRKSVEQAQSYTFKAVITVLATGLMGAIWLGVKVVLGK